MLDTIVCSEPLVWLFSPAWYAVVLTLDVGFICPFVVIDPTDRRATTVVAPGRMIDNFLPTLDAASLPLYRMVVKLACVCTDIIDSKDCCHSFDFMISYMIFAYDIGNDIIDL